jgi:hypothetical protein
MSSEPKVKFENINKDQGTGKATITGSDGKETVLQVGRRALMIDSKTDQMCDIPSGGLRGQVQDALATMDKKTLAGIVASLEIPPAGAGNECTIKANTQNPSKAAGKGH